MTLMMVATNLGNKGWGLDPSAEGAELAQQNSVQPPERVFIGSVEATSVKSTL
jgi:hypothetical protein